MAASWAQRSDSRTTGPSPCSCGVLSAVTARDSENARMSVSPRVCAVFAPGLVLVRRCKTCRPVLVTALGRARSRPRYPLITAVSAPGGAGAGPATTALRKPSSMLLRVERLHAYKSLPHFSGTATRNTPVALQSAGLSSRSPQRACECILLPRHAATQPRTQVEVALRDWVRTCSERMKATFFACASTPMRSLYP